MSNASQIVIDRNVDVVMRDGAVLRADVYRPADGRHPVLLHRTPYGKEVPMGIMVSLNPVRAAMAGYAVVVQDVRGRFGSDGDFTPFANEGLDGHDSVEWAAAQPWSTGRVGMFGSSYGAATQLLTAVESPPSLRAIAPFEGTSSYYEGRSYRGGAFELGSLLSIALVALGPGSIQRQVSGEEFRKIWRQIRAMVDDLPATASTLPLTDLRTTPLGTWTPYFFEWLEHDEPGEFWERISIEARHDRIGVPALHLSSWYDSYATGAIRNYLGIAANGATAEAREHQYLWLGPWGHYMPRTALNGVLRLGEMEFGLNALIDLDVVQLAWFDRWLKDEVTSWRFDSPVRLFVLGENRWRNEACWPVDAQPLILHLDGGGRLATTPPSDPAADEYVADPATPVPTVGGPHLMLESAFPQGPWDQRDVEARDDVVVYTTDELTNDIVVIGEPHCELWFSSTAPSADVVVTLSVVHADGTSLPVADGIRRVALEPGRSTNVTVELGPTAIRFTLGQRIRLRVASSNFPRWDLNPQTGERAATATRRDAARHSVHHDAARPSALHLPVSADEGVSPTRMT